MKEYREKLVSIPSGTEIKKIVVVPAKLVLINRDAAKGAKIIWLLRNLDDVLPAPILLR